MMEISVRLPQWKVSFRASVEVLPRVPRKEHDLAGSALKQESLDRVEMDISRSRERYYLLT